MRDTSTWGLLLAGGEGARLRDEVARRYGCSCPKQYCTFGGEHSLLERTIRRARQVVPEDRLAVITNRQHRKDAALAMAPHPAALHVEQPGNGGTTAGVLLPVFRILEKDPDAVVVVLPTDHHVEDERAFTRAIEAALELLREHPRQVVLLGAPPEGSIDGYGWIVPASGDRVAAFREKPPRAEAERLAVLGALVNTFVLVARATTLSYLVLREVPHWWWRLRSAVQDPFLYESAFVGIAPSDLSRDVLERAVDDLRVVRMEGAGWSDVGTPERLRDLVPEALAGVAG